MTNFQENVESSDFNLNLLICIVVLITCMVKFCIVLVFRFSIRVSVNASLSDEEIDNTMDIIEKACDAVLNK